jgi:hypothetical protein
MIEYKAFVYIYARAGKHKESNQNLLKNSAQTLDNPERVDYDRRNDNNIEGEYSSIYFPARENVSPAESTFRVRIYREVRHRSCLSDFICDLQ